MEAFLNTLIFWSIFAFTIGPFWIGIMELARHEPFNKIYKNYLIFQILSWLPMIIIIGIMVSFLGEINPQIFLVLYFVGGIIIFHLAYKTLRSNHSPNKKFSLNWQAMVILGFTNPKVWLTIPTGFISATFSNSLAINITLFYLISLPIFWLGLYFWYLIGRYGAKITRNKLTYFSTALLVGFSIYLFYQGLKLI